LSALTSSWTQIFLETQLSLNQAVRGFEFMDVKLPHLGEGSDSGVIVNLFVKEGDVIAKDQPILELENEKAVATIPSTAAGTVTKVFVKSGDKITVGSKIISLSESGQTAAPAKAASAAPPAKSKPAPIAKVEEVVAEEIATEELGEDVNPSGVVPAAAPSVRKLARELGINLTKVRGSESGGRIVLGDLRAHIARLQKLASQPKAAAAPAKPVAEQIDFSKWGAVTKKPMTSLRQIIARRMTENWNTIPHVTQFDNADFTKLNELRKKFTSAFEAKGVKLTLTPFVLKALVETLKKHPMFNSSLDEVANEIVIKEYFHIGIAVDTEQGLIVPVLRDVDKKTMLEISKELEQLAQKARDRKLTADELKGGTFTISNQGAIGGAHFTPIINKPEVAILGLGRGAMKPVVREGKVEIRMMTPLGLSYDHRVIDGGSAARFIVDLVKAMENFSEDAVKI
jgi:pyruvate dehydrogenase E2 component (dihydrolipoamide acetyltransferase)